MVTSKDKTLAQLDGEVWGEPELKSHLVVNCHRLRKVPLKDFTVEDLRLIIGQNLSLQHLVPLALEHLERDPFVEGDFYPGDLLVNVLGIQAGFWAQHPALRRKMSAIVEKASIDVESVDLTGELRDRVQSKLNAFGWPKHNNSLHRSAG